MSWPDIPIKDVCFLAVDCVNKTAPTVDYETSYKMIRTTSVRNGFVSTNGVRYVTEEVFRKWSRRSLPKKGDIILTREAPLGDVGRVLNDDTIFLGQRLFHYRADPQKIDPNYLLYALQSPLVQGRIKSKGFGATVQHVKVGECENLLIPVPAMPIQKKIGRTLVNYDDLIENNRRRIQLLEESARLLYREWFVHLRFPGHEHTKITNGIPEGWEECNLQEYIKIIHGYAFKGEYFDDQETTRILLTPGNFKIGGGIKLEKIKFYSESGPLEKRYILTEDDLVVTMTDLSKTSDTLGYSLLIPRVGGKTFLHNQRTGKIEPVKEGFFPKFFFYHLFQDNRYRSFVVGSSSGTSVKHTSPKKILVYKPLLPIIESSDLIERFDENASLIFKSIKNLIIQNQKLIQARDLLLPRLMNGEIAV